jgi:hypothetical protein
VLFSAVFAAIRWEQSYGQALKNVETSGLSGRGKSNGLKLA